MKAINIFKPKFRADEILSEIKECLDTNWTGLGFKTVQFEAAWKQYTGFKYAHFLNSNSSGLHLAVKILKDVNKWQDGDEIITTPLTFISTNHAIKYENLTPVFADVDDQLCLDPDSIIANITRKTKAVMFVGIGGNIGQFNKIIKICKEYGIKLILDAAHMAGTMIDNIHVGQKADVSVFSFQSVKNMPTADGGMICFKSSDYDALARKLSWLGIDKDTYNRTNSKGSYKWDYDVVDLGFKSHGNSIMASMGLVALKYLDEDNEKRREICNLYDEGFKNNKLITPILHNSDCTSSRHLYQIRVANRNDVMEYLNANDIFPGVHYKDNTEYQIYSNAKGTCPNAHKLSEEIISLPLHMFLTHDDISKVIKTVKRAVLR